MVTPLTVRGNVQSLARAALARTRPRTALLAMGSVVLISGLSLGLVPQVWHAATQIKLARFTETLVIVLFVVAANVVADEAVERGVPRVPAYGAALVAGVLLGVVLGPLLREVLGLRFGMPERAMNPVHRFTHPIEMAVFGLLVGGLATFVRVNRRTALQARRRQHEAEQARGHAQRRKLESQLQALQARVEPQFLFGTLEHIQRLYRSDAAGAGAMLEDLIVFLRAALPHLRESSSTVEQELRLVRSWLDIVGRTTCGGCDVELRVDTAALRARMPALVLLPLVQCAMADRGAGALRLRIDAHLGERRQVQLELHASTAAYAAEGEMPTDLLPVRERLQTLYGPSATLDCRTDALHRGSVCMLAWPLEQAAPDAASGRSGP